MFSPTDGSTVLGSNNWADVPPKESKLVYFTYKLSDPTAPIEITVSDLFETQSVSWVISPKTLPDHSPSSRPSNEEPTTLDQWLGGWYGWWMIFDGSGKYKELAEQTWDCLALAESLEENGICITVWDEDYQDYSTDPLSKVYLQQGPSQHLGIKTNSFFWNGKVTAEDWTVHTQYLKEAQILVITGRFTDQDGDVCQCGVVLCQWGKEWRTDVVAKPKYYDSYLAPLIKAGESLPLIWNPTP